MFTTNNGSGYRAQQREKNRKIIKDFPFLLAVGAKRNLLTDDIIIVQAIKGIDKQNVYFSLNKIDAPFLGLLHLNDIKADILVYFESSIKIGVKKISHNGNGNKLAKKIIESIPKNGKIINLAVIDLDQMNNGILFRDIIIYRHKNGDLRPIIEMALKQKTISVEPIRNFTSG